MGPREFRRLGTEFGHRAVAEMIPAQPSALDDTLGRISGHVYIPESDKLIMLGLFPRSLALGKPVACTSTRGPGGFQLVGVPDGTYCLLAAAHAPDATVSEALVAGCRSGLWVGISDNPVTVKDGQAERPARITLTPTADTDPPILTGIPLLSMMPPVRACGTTEG